MPGHRSRNAIQTQVILTTSTFAEEKANTLLWSSWHPSWEMQQGCCSWQLFYAWFLCPCSGSSKLEDVKSAILMHYSLDIIDWLFIQAILFILYCSEYVGLSCLKPKPKPSPPPPSVIEFCHIYQEEYGFKHCLVAVCSGFCKRQHEDLPLGRCINNTTPNMCCCREEKW
jgi:hypothetical protein